MVVGEKLKKNRKGYPRQWVCPSTRSNLENLVETRGRFTFGTGGSIAKVVTLSSVEMWSGTQEGRLVVCSWPPPPSPPYLHPTSTPQPTTYHVLYHLLLTALHVRTHVYTRALSSHRHEDRPSIQLLRRISTFLYRMHRRLPPLRSSEIHFEIYIEIPFGYVSLCTLAPTKWVSRL